MANLAEPDPRNIPLADRLDTIIKTAYPTQEQDITEATAVLNSLRNPEAAKAEYKTRASQLHPMLEAVDPNSNMLLVLAGAYHPIAISEPYPSGIHIPSLKDRREFDRLPKGFGIPAYKLKIKKRFTPDRISREIPTPFGNLPFDVLTPEGNLIEFGNIYFLDQDGNGIRITKYRYNPHYHLNLHDGSVLASDALHARRIPTEITPTRQFVLPGDVSTVPRILDQDDYKFLDKVLPLIEQNPHRINFNHS